LEMGDDNVIYQCALCGWFIENGTEPPKLCPDCGCSMIREATKETLDRVKPDAVTHFKKQVKKCWNYDVNPLSGGQSYHDLELVRDIDTRNAGPNVDSDKGMIVVRQRCKHCKQIYGQQFIPVTRVDELERLGILNQVRAFLPKSVLASA
jgi:predicted  nucleic acid-binding Zn-ribbon protein